MALAAIAVLSVSCREDEWFDQSPAAREGYVALRFSADVPAMEKVATRAVDPDGGGVQDMTLFCFDSYGLFITTVTATVKAETDYGGTFQAEVPENTRTVHFVANQVMTDFEQDQFRSKSEAEVMALLEGSSGRMIYWARFACDNSTDELKKQTIAEQMNGKGNSIKMLRNHAKVSVNAPKDNGYFTVEGFAVYNTNAFGTVAPYHPEKGFNFTSDDWLNNDFVTIPANDAKLSDVTDVTVMFTVPETAPAELFPLKVYISVGGLDIRNASGMELTVVRNGDKDWYSSEDITLEPDYKYLYIVEQPGVQRVYFENILSQNEDHTGYLYIEADHFATMTRAFTYSQTRNSITVEGLNAYNANGSGIERYPEDELILYRLVPQKRHANVQFDLQLRTKESDEIEDEHQGDPFNAGAKDEFLLYSRYLDYYEDNETGQAGVDAFDCTFYPDASETWWQANNPDGGRMLMFKPRPEIINRPNPNVGKYSIYMKSNRPKSAEVVRIASNVPGRDAVLSEDGNGVNNEYGGNSYRSVTFELANYNPFRFGARLNYDNEGEQGKEPDRVTNPNADVPELLTPLEWTYEPSKPVDIAIDITSFAGSDDNSVDPFGEEFEIYIDAPMLALGDNSDLKAGKLYEASPGRFVYKVDADRETERNYFPGSNVVNKDNTPGINVNQSGERKTLHFTTKSIVSAGDIVISSNEEQVVFYSKTFRVTNSSMGGNIYYTDESGSTQPIPSGEFVAFERVSNSSRIGAVTVPEEGKYELRLRKEYTFDWYTNPVQFHYELGGKVYHRTYESLSDLFGSQEEVVLTLEN